MSRHALFISLLASALLALFGLSALALRRGRA